MSIWGDNQSLNVALAHARDEGPANVYVLVVPREVRKRATLTHAQMAPNGDEPVGLSEMDTGNAQGRRIRGGLATRDPE